MKFYPQTQFNTFSKTSSIITIQTYNLIFHFVYNI